MMPMTARPCANCPFRNDGKGVSLAEGRIEQILSDLDSDDYKTFTCHKTIKNKKKERLMCAGALAVQAKMGRLPVIARLGLITGDLTQSDLNRSMEMVIDPPALAQRLIRN